MALVMNARFEGLEEAMQAVEAAFPKNPEMARKLLNQSMSGAAKGSIIPIAKQLALQGDGSGALSEAIAPRAVSRAQAMRRGRAAIVEVTPVRSNRSAMARYIAFHYTAKGRKPKAKMITSGIRHGHLVEFGVPSRGIPAAPFMFPAAQQGFSQYQNLFSVSLKKKIAAAVRKAAKKPGVRKARAKSAGRSQTITIGGI